MAPSITAAEVNLKENVMSERNGWSRSLAGMLAVGASVERSRNVGKGMAGHAN